MIVLRNPPYKPIPRWTRIAWIGFLIILLTSCAAQGPRLGGVWEIQEEDKSYIATLDEKGHGTYTPIPKMIFMAFMSRLLNKTGVGYAGKA